MPAATKRIVRPTLSPGTRPIPLAPHTITRPVTAVVAATGELAAGKLDYRVQAAAIDALGSLVESFTRAGQTRQAKTGQL